MDMKEYRDPFHLTETAAEKRLRHIVEAAEYQRERQRLWKVWGKFICAILVLAIAVWLKARGVEDQSIGFWIGGCGFAGYQAQASIRSRNGKPPSRSELIFACAYILLFIIAAAYLFVTLAEIDRIFHL